MGAVTAGRRHGLAAACRERRFALALTGAVVLALIARLWGLGSHSLWFDEALEVERASLPLRQLVSARGIDQDPPLYPLLLRGLLAVDRSDAWLRLPGVLLGALAVLLAGVWGRRVGGAWLGLAAASLLAVAPAAVHYAQEVNQYAVVWPLAVGLALALEAVVVTGGRGRWLGYSLLCVAAVATHYGLALLVAAQLVPLASQAARASRQRRSLAVHVGLLAVAIVVLWHLGLGRNLEVDHVQARFGGTDLARELAYVADTLWRDVLVFFSVPFSGGMGLHVARVVALAAAVGSAWLWRRGAAGRRAVGVAFLLPLALSYGAGGMGWYPLGHRYGLMAAPAYLLVAAGAVAALARRSARAAALTLAALVGALAAFLPQLDARNPDLVVPRQELRPVLVRLAARADPDQTLYVYHGARPAFAKYAADGILGPAPRVLPGRSYDQHSAPAEAERLTLGVPPGAAAWLVFAQVAPGDHEVLLEHLLLAVEPRWRLVQEIEERNAMAYLVERLGAPHDG